MDVSFFYAYKKMIARPLGRHKKEFEILEIHNSQFLKGRNYGRSFSLKRERTPYTDAAVYPALYNILKVFRYRLRSFSWAYPFLLA